MTTFLHFPLESLDHQFRFFDLAISFIPLFLFLFAGQEQDSLGGGFQRDQSYSGEITQLSFWDSYLSREAIGGVSLLPCCTTLSTHETTMW